PGTAHTVTGLVLAGIAAVAVALRSVRSRSRGTD
ncbi:membrane protein, partial [Streptomyces coelicoflavus ZG0656]